LAAQASMETARAQAIVKENIKQLRWALQLQDWQISNVCERIEDKSDDSEWGDTAGYCLANPNYRAACITLDADKIDDEADVLAILRHEMLHLFHAELSRVFLAQVKTAVSEREYELLGITFAHCIERIVGRIEYMLDIGLGMQTKAMVRRAKRHLERGK